MATREEKIAFLQSQSGSQVPGVSAPAQTRAEKIAFLQSKMNQQSEPPEESTLSKIGSAVMAPINAVGTAVDYLDAPIKQAAIAPARMLRGEGVIGPLFDIPAQLVKGPSQAPSWKDVYTKYGVPDKKVRMSNLENAHPELGVLPDAMFDEKDMIDTPSAASRLGFATEMGMSGVGLRSLMKVPSLAKAGVGLASKAIAKGVGEGLTFTPVADADKIVASAKAIGVPEVPKGVLTDNQFYQELESGLAQSGSIPARKTNLQYKTFHENLDKAAQKIRDLRGGESDVGIGKDIQAGLINETKSMKKPVSELYESFTPDLTKIEVNDGAINRAFGQLKKNNLFKSKEGADLLDEVQKGTQEQPNVYSLKEWRDILRGRVSKQSSPTEKAMYEELARTMTDIRDRSIHAQKEIFPKEMHPAIDDLMSELALADAAHSSNVKDLNSVKGIVGNKPIKSPSQFIEQVANMSGEDLAKSASSLDYDTFNNLKAKMPKVFERAKQARINDLVDRSSSGGQFNENKFLKQYESLDSEMKSLLFSPEERSHIENFQVVKQAVPPQLGPSGTPKGKMTMEMVSPQRNYLDYATKKALEYANPAAKVAAESEQPSNLVQLARIQGASKAIPRIVEDAVIQKAADNVPEQKLKGKEKWASDGFNKIIEHAGSSKSKEELQKFKDSFLNDQKSKDLLIKASDLTPGSKAMDDVLKKLKERVSKGNE